MYLKGCYNYVLHEIESTSMKRSIESALWCIGYRFLVVHGHPTKSNTESTNVGVWIVVLWQWSVTEELSIGKDHKEDSKMIYTATHKSCTASVIHTLPHARLLYSHACASVILNADKHLIILYTLSQNPMLLLMLLTCMCMQAELKLCKDCLVYIRPSIHTLK